MPDTPDPLDLDAVQALADAATEGPWRVWPHPPAVTNRPNGLHAIAAAGDVAGSLVRITVAGRADAEFVAAARHLVPALVAEVRRQRSLLAEQAAHMGELLDQVPEAAPAIRPPLVAFPPDLAAKLQGSLHQASRDFADGMRRALGVPVSTCARRVSIPSWGIGSKVGQCGEPLTTAAEVAAGFCGQHLPVTVEEPPRPGIRSPQAGPRRDVMGHAVHDCQVVPFDASAVDPRSYADLARADEHWNARLIREAHEAREAWSLPLFISLSHTTATCWGWSCHHEGKCAIGLVAKGPDAAEQTRAAIKAHLGAHHVSPSAPTSGNGETP